MKYVLMGLIRLYQWTLSPLFGQVCRYYPSCSHYGYEAIGAHGAAKGVVLTTWRVLRCNPWSRGGYDPVPARGAWRPTQEPPTQPEVETVTDEQAEASHARLNELGASKQRTAPTRAGRTGRASTRRGAPTTVQGA